MGEPFRIKDEETVFEDIEFAARHMTRQRRLFLCDGDAMTIPLTRLTRILTRIGERLPRLTRIGAYASAKGLRGKSLDDLRLLKEQGLSMAYMGLESGDDALLQSMGKEAGVAEMLEQAAKVRQAGLKLSVTVIVGLAGAHDWQRHARLTGEALTAMQPDHAAALSLIPVPGTPLWHDIKGGKFEQQNAHGMVRELRMLLEHTQMTRGLFLADHASNHVPLKLRLPRDRAYGLELLDAALAGEKPLKPERARGL